MTSGLPVGAGVAGAAGAASELGAAGGSTWMGTCPTDGPETWVGVCVGRTAGSHRRTGPSSASPMPNYTIGTNSDAIHATSTDKRPVCAAGILQYPGVLFMAQHSMTPRDTGISKHDVGSRIPAQLVVRTRLQSMVRLPGPNDQYWASPRRSGTQRRHADDCKGDVHKGE